jgi:predicted transcriptional regulator of viral defense system
MDKALRLLRRQGTLRPRDLAAKGIPRDYLDRLHHAGKASRVGRGLYAFANADVTEHHSLAVVARLVPRGTVCLLSALQFHGITTQSPASVWLALPSKAWAPTITSPRICVVRYSGGALTDMIQTHRIESVAVRVYSPAKTVADCFKFRSRVGLEVAIEALRDCWRQRRATMDELWAAACVCRMVNVMRPYMESLA